MDKDTSKQAYSHLLVASKAQGLLPTSLTHQAVHHKLMTQDDYCDYSHYSSKYVSTYIQGVHTITITNWSLGEIPFSASATVAGGDCNWRGWALAWGQLTVNTKVCDSSTADYHQLTSKICSTSSGSALGKFPWIGWVPLWLPWVPVDTGTTLVVLCLKDLLAGRTFLRCTLPLLCNINYRITKILAHVKNIVLMISKLPVVN